MMNLEQFVESIKQPQPPSGISVYLRSLWLDGKGDWEGAHEAVQDLEDKTSAWIHAYLHRKEGDNGNARYWYNKVGKQFPDVSLQEEWRTLVANLLDAR